MVSLTPIRNQYLSIKKNYPDAILLFRMGDFYETFDEDARITSEELDIALTGKEMGKGQRVPLAGIPYHALDTYLARLVKRGHKVAICDQISGPSSVKGLVERQVVRVVTPGTLIEPTLLEEGANNYLAALVISGNEVGLSYVDISTSEFSTTQISFEDALLEIERIGASEILIRQSDEKLIALDNSLVTNLDDEIFDVDRATKVLEEHFNGLSLESFGCKDMPLAIAASGAIINYLSRTQGLAVERLGSLHTYIPRRFMLVDQQTKRNLGLFTDRQSGGGSASLLSVIDLTNTSMGGRLLRKWMGQPLIDLEALEKRQNAIESMYVDQMGRDDAMSHLKQIPDLERLLNRIAIGVAIPRDILALRKGLLSSGNLKGVIQSVAEFPSEITNLLDGCDVITDFIFGALDESLGGNLGQGWFIQTGFSEDLDSLKKTYSESIEYVASLERLERERTGIKSLKVGYNRVFGYYIEVSNVNLGQVPSGYSRRQTLVNGERFITQDLKEYEAIILNTHERIKELEANLFRDICNQITEYQESIKRTAGAIAQIDLFVSLAHVAALYNYVRPKLTNDDGIEIEKGRHPVVERLIPYGSFVPNDTFLDNIGTQVVLLTGPNMAGKSTYIKQVGLIVMLAQIGSFVPAKSATIGIVDRIYTRFGLQDDLATGQSTFMVEMVETANILRQATKKSLILLDEIGRGTSTYDGLAIAKATAEHIHDYDSLGCKTLFATHYHELTQLSEELSRVRNFSMAAIDNDGQLVFLHTVVSGESDRSYGVQVAHLAGIPSSVIKRAWEILQQLEHDDQQITGFQSPLFLETHPILDEILSIDLSRITPLDAINKLHQLQTDIRESV